MVHSLDGNFFFFKQKTAYEMLRSLVGSEMCIRDRLYDAVLTDDLVLAGTAVEIDGVPTVWLAGTPYALSLIHI